METDALRKLCRICLSDGEFNIWQHKITLPIASKNSKEELVEEEVTIHDVMANEFAQPQKVLALSIEMDLICNACILELQSCARFYRKMQFANKEIQKLYTESIIYESDEQVEEVDGVYNFDDASLDESNPECSFQTSLQEILRHSLTPPKPPTPKKPTIVLTGNISQMISNVHVVKTAQKRVSVSEIMSSPSKRQCTKPIRRYKNANYKSSESDSVVVTQFIPTESLIQSNDDFDLIDTSSSLQEMRTLEYAAVQVKTSQLQDVHAAIKNTTQETVYACNHCPQAFSASEFLITHLLKSHVCKICTKAFDETAMLHEHIRKEHVEHKCVVCDKVLSSSSNLRSHINRVHGLKLPKQTTLIGFRLSTEEMEDTDNNLVDLVDEDDSVVFGADDTIEYEDINHFENEQ